MRTNVSIHEEIKINDRLTMICPRRVLQFFGHIERRGEPGKAEHDRYINIHI